jgi:hypothetical protein
VSLIKTLRGPKIGGLAVFDLASAFAGMWLLAPKLGISRERALWAAVPVGLAVHQVLGIETPLNRRVLGPGHVVEKLAVAGMTYQALRPR